MDTYGDEILVNDEVQTQLDDLIEQLGTLQPIWQDTSNLTEGNATTENYREEYVLLSEILTKLLYLGCHDKVKATTVYNNYLEAENSAKETIGSN